ncbi:MAG TPA: class I SAM-dependent methyltransferase [Allosphingosinicella sp.]|nr:class I SAM-dependent methyltransferase [Allosphingosinicella sp.]
MKFLRRLRTLLPKSVDIAIAKDSQRAREVAALLRKPLRQRWRSLRPLWSIEQRMEKMLEPHPDPKFGTIADHYLASSSWAWKLAILERLVEQRRAGSILEIGTAYGGSAVAMALAQQEPNLVTIDFFAPQSKIGPENIRSVVPSGVECLTEDKNLALPRLVHEGRRFDFVFHDGGHSGDNYVDEFRLISKALEPGSIFVFDDITWDNNPANRATTKDWSRRTCYEGWLEVLSDPKVEGAVIAKGSIGILLTA